jgi:hypothetical protein
MANIIPDAFKLELLSGTHNFASGGNTFKIALYVTTLGPPYTTSSTVYSATNEVSSSGTGYATGGQALDGQGVSVPGSSNSDSAVDFAAGSKEVFCTLPSEKAIYLDGSDAQVGGFASLADDGSPQLGGDLDVVTFDIVSTSDRDIDIIPNGTGDVNLGADTVQVGDNDANATITTQGTGDLILNTNNGTNAGDITLLDGANGNINLAPNGTGEIVIGSGSADGDITTSGTYDLIVDTNGGTNAGNITLTNGANGAITLTPNGTGVVAIEGSMNPSVSSTGKALVMGF